MRKLARWAAAALLIAVMAVTPLGAVFSAGRYETWLPSWDLSGRASAHVTLDDQTGLVRAISPARPAAGPGDLDTVVNPGGNRWLLVVTWGDSSCLREAHLGLRPSGDGYVLDEHATARNCGFLDLAFYSAAIHLWSPVDASLVDFVALD